MQPFIALSLFLFSGHSSWLDENFKALFLKVTQERSIDHQTIDISISGHFTLIEGLCLSKLPEFWASDCPPVDYWQCLTGPVWWAGAGGNVMPSTRLGCCLEPANWPHQTRGCQLPHWQIKLYKWYEQFLMLNLIYSSSVCQQAHCTGHSNLK